MRRKGGLRGGHAREQVEDLMELTIEDRWAAVKGAEERWGDIKKWGLYTILP